MYLNITFRLGFVSGFIWGIFNIRKFAIWGPKHLIQKVKQNSTLESKDVN